MNLEGHLVGPNMHVLDPSDSYHHTLTEKCPCGVRWKGVWSDDGIVWQFIHQVVGYNSDI